MQDVAAFIHSNERVARIGRWDLTHLFFPREEQGGCLLVCCGGNKYGYIKSFYGHGTCHLLYLCDNLGPDGTSLWWMADRGDFGVRDAYVELIRDCVEQCGVAPEDVCFMGNCKGGFGALYLSYAIGAGRVLAIAPYVALGTVFGNSEQLWRIVGDSGIVLDDHIISHFNRPSDVHTHIITSAHDKMMRQAHVDKLLSLLVRNGNVMTMKALVVEHPEDVSDHVSICGALTRDDIMNELDQQMVRPYGARL